MRICSRVAVVREPRRLWFQDQDNSESISRFARWEKGPSMRWGKEGSRHDRSRKWRLNGKSSLLLMKSRALVKEVSVPGCRAPGCA